MKMNIKHITTKVTIAASFAVLATSCTENPDSPGVEWMPDMYRSPAIEAYVDYGEIRNEERKEFKSVLSAKTPPAGTIPYQSNPEDVSIMMPYKRKAPLDADKTHGLFGMEQDKDAVEMSAMDKNPLPYSKETFTEGKKLYNRMCSHCHGEKGDGNGQMVKNGKISGVANFTAGSKDVEEGKLFYYITYGKGIMGAHASQINKKDRWKIVQYVKGLQNGGNYPADAGLGIKMEADSSGKFVSTVLKDIYFVAGKSSLNERKSNGALMALLSFMRINENAVIELSGHTDNTGSDADNNPLSQQRADGVKAYIVSKGISADRIVTKGYGSTMPIADNATAEGRNKNRRTEVKLISK